MMNHSPGPWDFDGCTESGKPSSGENCRYHQIDARTTLTSSMPYTVCDTLNRHHYISSEEDAANARLIAAAPSLYDALINVKKFFTDLEDGTELCDPLRAIRKRVHAPIHKIIDTAIDKANGRETIQPHCTCTPIAGSWLCSIKDKACPIHGEAKG
jgi:hypothetical protein